MGTDTQTISLPGWEDIISIPHGPKPSKAELSEYYKAKAAKRAANIPPDRIAEIERRNSTRQRMLSSTIPAEAQKWGNVLTWLDDAQDLFSLVTVGGRIAVRAAPKALGRFIPGLGWVLLAADILKLLTLLASLAQPFFVGMCAGWRKGTAAAIPALAMGNALKLMGHGIASLNPFSRASILARQAKFAGKLFRVGEMLEFAQAMKTLTGYGLTLGGIMGTIYETSYAIELFLRGGKVNIRAGGSSNAQISLSDGTAYGGGSPAGMAKIYSKLADTITDPTSKANAKARAQQLADIGL